MPENMPRYARRLDRRRHDRIIKEEGK